MADKHLKFTRMRVVLVVSALPGFRKRFALARAASIFSRRTQMLDYPAETWPLLIVINTRSVLFVSSVSWMLFSGSVVISNQY